MFNFNYVGGIIVNIKDNLLKICCANACFTIDFHCIQCDFEKYIDSIKDLVAYSFEEMDALENGAIANPDEQRMVGHYWLRDTSVAPTEWITWQIDSSLLQITDFTEKIHTGEILSSSGTKFRNLIVAGIGGSQLGFQFITDAMKNMEYKMTPYTIDNNDPDGIELILRKINDQLSETLVIFISKSGSTIEIRNMILELQVAFSTKKIPFEKHFIAVTMQGSPMEKVAREENWLNVFPTWDWVGGRVSVFSSVGLLPLALLGISINDLLFGAREMDKITRNKTVINNPAMLLSVAWKYFKEERKITTMVTLPYKDRLSFFSRYLQQLVMESLGKNKTRQGEKTCTGLTVYGNKGSTDQHAYVQQLREGICDFFTLFLLVKKDRDNIAPIVNHSTITTGDYLWAFCLGTQKALFEKNRESILLTMDKISPTVIGALIALFERAVGFYAYMLNVNAYNQPGVEAGKICAEDIISLQEKINIFLSQKKYIELTVEEIAQSIGSDDLRLVSYLVEHYRANH